MTAPDPGAALRAVLLDRAEAAMSATDTERELDELHARLRPTARSRRLRMAAAAAGVAAVGAAIGLAVSQSGGSAGAGPTSVTPPATTPSPHWTGTIPAGFPTGTYDHPGTFGLTTLILRRNGTASLQDPRGIPTQMQITFAAPNLVRFTDTEPSATTVTTSCADRDGIYQWRVALRELRLTLVSDPCGNRQIPLSEIPWGPIKSG